jgi:hypothetical protein
MVEQCLLAGQIDANDPSRFTIPFEWGGASGEIEGAVASGAQVRLKVVSGPACESPEPDWA